MSAQVRAVALAADVEQEADGAVREARARGTSLAKARRWGRGEAQALTPLPLCPAQRERRSFGVCGR